MPTPQPRPLCESCGQEIPDIPFDVLDLLGQEDLEEFERARAEREMCEPWHH